MEKESRWNFCGNEKVKAASVFSIKRVIMEVTRNLNTSDERPIIPFSYGDPSSFSCFRAPLVAEDAVVDAVRSAKFNGYSPSVGLPQARRSIAEYLSRDLPDKLSPDDVYLTVGAKQAIEVVMPVLARPGANILLPRPSYPTYDACAAFCGLETRHFDLLPAKGWEVDLDGVKNLADDKTVAMVLINPGNPCGNVFKFEHLKKVAETAEKLGILLIADEVYGHLAYGNTPFVPMGVFGSIVPVITIGSLSKRWFIPGWRLGWIAIVDPTCILEKLKIVEGIKGYINVVCDPATFIQGAVPQIIEKTSEDFYLTTTNIIREDADICFDGLKEIPCIICPHKPEGSMFVMVRLDTLLLEDINDDMEFCIKLAKEESVIILPGLAMGMKNWLRINFACEQSALKDGLGRLKAFCLRHAKKQ